MFRLPPSTWLLCLGAAALFSAGCRSTVYKDVYAPKRNHFKAPVERSNAADLLPPDPVTNTTTVTTMVPTGGSAESVPGASTPSVPAAPSTAPAAPSDPSVIPGLDAIPGAPPTMTPM